MQGVRTVLQMTNLRRLAGKQVIGPGGERIGKVADVYESTAADGGTFATVTTGLFGTSSSFFPLDTAELVDDELHVPYSKDVIRQAPRVENDDELTAEEEARLFSYYGLLDTAQPAARTAPAAAPGTDDGAMTLSEERLHVGTERVVAGRARLRKYVVEERVSQTVPVSHEELRVVREPVAPGEVPAVAELSEERHEVLLYADRPVVRKEVVPVERVRLGTVVVEGQETVTGEVRKEHVVLEQTQADGTSTTAHPQV
jgi:uncharacterized protein (TIGR02271 family)